MINVERWIDLDSVEAKQIEQYNFIRETIDIAIRGGIIKADNLGHLFTTKDKNPVHAEINGKLVGLRFCAKASN